MNATTNPDLLSELDRVRGLVTAYDDSDVKDHLGAVGAHLDAGNAAIALFRRPDFLALFEALREPVGYIAQMEINSLRCAQKVGAKHEAVAWESPTGQAGIPLYALHTKERDDG